MTSSGTLETLVGRRLTTREATLATAESCTGGLIAHRITNVSGASGYYLGGVVSYSNDVKVRELGVSADDLAAHGAVSEPVARQMAEGVRARFGADYAVAVTGIAGPTGGTEEKPVGLVFIAVAGGDGTRVTCSQFTGARKAIKEQTAQAALQALWDILE